MPNLALVSPSGERVAAFERRQAQAKVMRIQRALASIWLATDGLDPIEALVALNEATKEKLREARDADMAVSQ